MLIKDIFSRCDHQTNINKYRSLYYFITSHGFLSLLVGLYGCLVTMHCCPQECDFAKIKVEEPRQIFTVGFETQVVLICDNCFIVLWQLVSFPGKNLLLSSHAPQIIPSLARSRKDRKVGSFVACPKFL